MSIVENFTLLFQFFLRKWSFLNSEFPLPGHFLPITRIVEIRMFTQKSNHEKLYLILIMIRNLIETCSK